jgi:hypothetical protein
MLSRSHSTPRKNHVSGCAQKKDAFFILTTYTHSCLRNVVSLFHIISKEQEWRLQQGRLEGFEMLQRAKPIVAVGADKPLQDEMMTADFFRTYIG